MMKKIIFAYGSQGDGYHCPQGQLLAYATTDRSGYRHYRSDPAICRDCPQLASCTTNAKAIYRRRKETVERSFRRRQATAWAPLCPLPKSDPRRLPVPDRSRRAENQKDRHLPLAQAQTQPRLRQSGLLSTSPDANSSKLFNHIKQKPRRNSTGFVCSLNKERRA